MAKVTVDGVDYSSQEALRKRVRSVLNDSPLNTPLREHMFVLALISRHHDAEEKIGVGIAHFEVRLHKAMESAKTSRGFYIIRVDGSIDTFGIDPCVTGKTDTFFQKVQKCCREAVASQSFAFKNAAFDAGPVTCTCGVALLYKETQVDHVESFQKIMDEWYTRIGSRYHHIPMLETFGGWAFDTAARDHFAVFHKSRTILRLICGPCNRSRKKYKSTFIEPKNEQ